MIRHQRCFRAGSSRCTVVAGTRQSQNRPEAVDRLSAQMSYIVLPMAQMGEVLLVGPLTRALLRGFRLWPTPVTR
jgi:hypothetical protein